MHHLRTPAVCENERTGWAEVLHFPVSEEDPELQAAFGQILAGHGWTLLCSTGVKVWGWLQGESWLYVANVGDSRAVKQPSILQHAVVICHNLLQPSRNILMCNDMSNDPFWNQGFTIAWLAAPHQKKKPTGPFTSFSLWSSPFRTIWGSGLSNGGRPLRNLGLPLSVKSHQIIPLRGIVWRNIQSYESYESYVIDVIDLIDVVWCRPMCFGSFARSTGWRGITVQTTWQKRNGSNPKAVRSAGWDPGAAPRASLRQADRGSEAPALP